MVICNPPPPPQLGELSRDEAINVTSAVVNKGKRGKEGRGGVKLVYKTKKPKSTLMADKTQGLIPTKQTKPRLVASAAGWGGAGMWG